MGNKRRDRFVWALRWAVWLGVTGCITSLLVGGITGRGSRQGQATAASVVAQEPNVFLPLLRYDAAAYAWRVGYSVSTSPITQYAGVETLSAGWYADWVVRQHPPTPNGIEYIQIIRVHQRLACGLRHHSDRVACPYAEPLAFDFLPDATTIQAAAQTNPGALWLIGNEMDRRDWAYCLRWQGTFCEEVGYNGQDEILPESYAVAYHELATLVRSADPTAKLAIGGVIQATPLRLAYLSAVWEAYLARYGEPMPVDIWNVHNFILQEQHNNWGADVPPGSDAEVGEYIGSTQVHLDLAIFERQVRAFRQWMKERGQQEKPLIVSEYGVLFSNEVMGFPADDPSAVLAFMVATFDFFAHTRDCSLGFTRDDCRLVQRWNWFSLDGSGDGFNSFGPLVDPNGADLSVTGRRFREYVQANLAILGRTGYD